VLIGKVDDFGRALVSLPIRPEASAQATEVSAWIDTAFTGELVIPRRIIQSLGLSKSASVLAGLADGTKVVLDCYSCTIDWFGTQRAVEVVENDGALPLLGIGLLRSRRVTIDYRSAVVRVE